MPAGARTGHLHALVEWRRPRVLRAAHGAAARQPPTLVFTGVMDYLAERAGRAMVRRRGVAAPFAPRCPEVRFVIVGSKPTEAVQATRPRGPGIEVTGFVDDVRVFLADASVCIVPLKIARGLQNKVLEAMAMGKAVVCTSQSLEGIRASVGDDVIVADDEAGFASQVLNLLQSPQRAEEIGRNARRCVENSYSWEGQSAPARCIAGAFVSRLSTIIVREQHGIARAGEAIRMGVPLARGALADAAQASLIDAQGQPLRAQFRPLAPVAGSQYQVAAGRRLRGHERELRAATRAAARGRGAGGRRHRGAGVRRAHSNRHRPRGVRTTAGGQQPDRRGDEWMAAAASTRKASWCARRVRAAPRSRCASTARCSKSAARCAPRSHAQV